MTLLRRRAKTGPAFAYCEPVTASPISPAHIRRVGPEGLLTGGGVPVPALCGKDLRAGWDLPYPVDPDGVRRTAREADGHPGRTCPACANAYFAQTG